MVSSSAGRETFFKMVFGPGVTGYVCIGYIVPGRRGLDEHYFEYPKQLPEMLDNIVKFENRMNVYFCPHLLKDKRRTKEAVKYCTTAWADLDACDPSYLLVPPSITMETSPGRYQALWCFEDPLDPDDAEHISKRIAYAHAPQGADRSGWDLTQLLRVPLTANRKYGEVGMDIPRVKVIEAEDRKYRKKDFEVYPQIIGSEKLDIPFPEEFPDITPEQLFEKYKRRLVPLARHDFEKEPQGEWSTGLFRLEMSLFDAGMSREEVFIVAEASACNKFKRDDREKIYLWKDVCRAFGRHEENLQMLAPEPFSEAALLTEEEREQVERDYTFVERYIDWAASLGDASRQYHQASGFTILSTMLSGSITLPTSFGMIAPNLWFMILGDTTLTRKSTAMDIGMDIIADIDPDAILATDGSVEGLLTALSTRPRRPSIFLRDEVSGLLDAMFRKDYNAGMMEMFTKLYDGKTQKRILRKETIEAVDPILIFYGGGIKNRVQSMVSYDHISSGFIPRFIFITAESDPDKVKPLGPPTEKNNTERDAILQEVRQIVKHYRSMPETVIDEGGSAMIKPPRRHQASLSEAAWAKYNAIDLELQRAGLDADEPDIMTPVYDRLSKSGLKAAILIAASRMLGDSVLVEETDILKAFWYVEQWRAYANDVIRNVGRAAVEKQFDMVYQAIVRKNGVTKSQLMQTYHMTARDASVVFETLEQRGMITGQKAGRTTAYFPVKTGKKGLFE